MAWTMTFANGLVCDGTTSYVNKRGQNDFRAEGPQGWIKIKNAFAYRDLEGARRNRLTYNPRPPVRFKRCKWMILLAVSSRIDHRVFRAKWGCAT